jgi:hypothetical protein
MAIHTRAPARSPAWLNFVTSSTAIEVAPTGAVAVRLGVREPVRPHGWSKT